MALDSAVNLPAKRHLWPATILPHQLDLSRKTPVTTLVASANTAHNRASSLQLFPSRGQLNPQSDTTLSHTHDISIGGTKGNPASGVRGSPFQDWGSHGGHGSLTALSASPGSTATRAAHSANVSSGALSVATPTGAGISMHGTHSTAVASSGVTSQDPGGVQLAHVSDVWNNVSRGTVLAFSPPPATSFGAQVSTSVHGMNRNMSHLASLNARVTRSSSISDASVSQSRGNTTSRAGNNPGTP